MKNRILHFALVFLLPFISYAGNIKGFVKDSDSGEGLIGVNVIVKGTTIGTITDINGNYELKNIPDGEKTIVVSYLGYVTQEKTVTIESNKPKTLNYSMVSDSYSLNEVVITVQTKGQLSAINQQMKSNSISNVVSSEKIQEVPDANAAESVGRLPGVSIQSEDGEGSKVVIRGLEPRYNLITINGVRAPSTSNEDNSVSMAGISPFMIDGISVQKSLTPDKDADVVGGIVDLKLKDADEGFHANLLFQNRFPVSIDNNNFNPLATLQLSNRFFDNKLGVILVGSYEKINRSSNIMNAGVLLNAAEPGKGFAEISSVNLNNGDIIRERTGLSMFLDYKLENTKILANAFVNGLQNKSINRSFSYSPSFNITKNMGINERSSLSLVSSLGLEQNIYSTKLKIALNYTQAKNDKPLDYSLGTKLYGDLNLLPQEVQKKLGAINTSPYYVSDLLKYDNDSAYVLYNLGSNTSILEEREFTAKLDYEIPFSIGNSIAGKFKIGGKYRSKTRTYDENSYGTGLSSSGVRDAVKQFLPAHNEGLKFSYPGARAYVGENIPVLQLMDDYSNEIFDGVTLDGYVKPEYMKQIVKSLDDQNWSPNEAATSDQQKLLNDYEGTESTYAGYAMADLNITKYLQLVGGARYEEMFTSYASNGIYELNDLGGVIETFDEDITDRKNRFLLPMVNAKITPYFEWMSIRLAYTQSIARPRYYSFMPRYRVSRDGRLSDFGNPSLKPALSTNLDANLSFYSRKLGLLTFGYFKKNIEDFEYYRTYRLAQPGVRDYLQELLGYGLNKSWEGLSTVNGFFVNNPHIATVQGFEVDWQTTFYYLPKPFNGIVFSANYTYNESEQKETRTKVITETSPVFPFPTTKTYRDTIISSQLTGQPKHIVNASIGYDIKGFSARLSYKRTAENYLGDLTEDDFREAKRYAAPYQQWDLSLTQYVPGVKGMQVFVNFSNITSAINGNYFKLTEGVSQKVTPSAPKGTVTDGSNELYPLNDNYYSNYLIIGLRYRL